MKKKSIISIVILLVSFVIVGGSSFFETRIAEAANTHQLIIGTGGVSGSYYPTGGALARVWTKYIDDVSASAQATGASLENTKLLDKAEIELGLTQTDLIQYAVSGEEMFTKKYSNLQVIASLFSEHIHLFVRRDSGIKTIADLKGKKVAVGSQGSGPLVNSRQIFEIFGVTFKDFTPLYLTNIDAVDRMKDGLLDAIFTTTAAPNATYQDLCIAKDVELYSFTEEELKKIVTRYPFFKEIVIPQDAYHGQNQDINTVAVRAVIAVRDDLSEDVAYNLTKVMWEKRGELVEMMAKLNQMDPEDPVKGVTVPVHKGSVKYYKEAGVWKD